MGVFAGESFAPATGADRPQRLGFILSADGSHSQSDLYPPMLASWRLATEVRYEIGRGTENWKIHLLNELGRVYALLGERELALEILRTLMTGPNSFYVFGTPRLIRFDPCWSHLATDPRFDEILKAAKPL